jgi:hypothetical protein
MERVDLQNGPQAQIYSPVKATGRKGRISYLACYYALVSAQPGAACVEIFTNKEDECKNAFWIYRNRAEHLRSHLTFSPAAVLFR